MIYCGHEQNGSASLPAPRNLQPAHKPAFELFTDHSLFHFSDWPSWDKLSGADAHGQFSWQIKWRRTLPPDLWTNRRSQSAPPALDESLRWWNTPETLFVRGGKKKKKVLLPSPVLPWNDQDSLWILHEKTHRRWLGLTHQFAEGWIQLAERSRDTSSALAWCQSWKGEQPRHVFHVFSVLISVRDRLDR